jgi:hypothetical protein
MAGRLASVVCMDDNINEESCDWYHESWQYLRLIDLVSNPCWHRAFFKSAINDSTNWDDSILISGTADYTILSVIVDALSRKQIQSSEITVLDACRTPLLLCEWYASKQNISISNRNDDIREINFEGQFDLILTDAFLTRFPHETKREIIDKWSGLLTDGGMIATTIRIKPDAMEQGGSRNESPESFATRAQEKATALSECPGCPDQIAAMAKQWKTKIQSYPVVSVDEAIEIFSESSDLDICITVNSVPRETGEVTRYCQIKATY